jgi:ribonucleoside-diphosphate reductase alpha chain
MRRGRCSIRASCRNSPTCSARISSGLRTGRTPGQGRAHGARTRAVRADDAHAGADRQRLDDVQGQVQPRQQPDAAPGNVIHLSNLCTEILEVTSAEETAVCNLGSINLSRHFDEDGQFDFDTLAETVQLAVRQLDRVIDLNFYPIDSARRGNLRWRPVGLGVMGCRTCSSACACLRQPRRRARSRRGSPRPSTSTRSKPRASWPIEQAAASVVRGYACGGRRAAVRCLGRGAGNAARWDALRAAHPRTRTAQLAADRDRPDGHHRLHRRLLRVRRAADQSNLFKRETLSGDFLQVNRYLVDRAEEARPLDARDARCDQAGRRLDPGHRPDPGSLARGVPHAWEIPMRALIDMAADRGAFIDQSSR